MKILHSSDWHLGRRLYGRSRYAEFEAFLNWLSEQIVCQEVDVLLIAGDVFDTATPSNRAQKLYYQFLSKTAISNCRHIVIIGGNHDSPSFLEAPKLLLDSLRIHVVGRKQDEICDELLSLKDSDGNLQLLVCAVPYLRDQDLRQLELGESIEAKEQKLLLGLKAHYKAVVDEAKRQQQNEQLKSNRLVPMIAMGHLFTAGGQTAEGDGVRELYVGNLAHIDISLFDDGLDYVALGHLHVPQKVAKNQWVRYSGSPIAMGFGEANQQKSVCLLEFEQHFSDQQHSMGLGTDKAKQLSLIEVPKFQILAQIRSDLNGIYDRLDALLLLNQVVWLEVIYQDTELVTGLRGKLETYLLDKQDDSEASTETGSMELLRIKNQRLVKQVSLQRDSFETLDELEPAEVFDRCLSAHDIETSQQDGLKLCYAELLQQLRQ